MQGRRRSRSSSDTVASVADGTLFDQGVGTEGPPTLRVGELAQRIAKVTAATFPGDLWVEGQIRNLSRSANGHAYFDLAEPAPAGETPTAQVSVTLLAPERRFVNDQLTRAGGAVRMEDGIEVRIRGRLRWYAPRGTLQLRMSGIDPTFTLGRLQADRERTLAVLAAEGLLDTNRTRPLPLVPLRVGLVTSVASAAHADVLSELTASGFGFTVRVVDARTQGLDCAPSVVRALTVLADDQVDVVLLVRGGGARTDLAGFDTELIARAVAHMTVPVLTGIGHEVDRSITDEVAHSAHKTPTAAAAAVVARVRAFLDRIDLVADGTRRAALAATQAATGRIDSNAGRAGRAALRALDRHESRLDRDSTRIAATARRTLEQADQAMGDRARRTAGRSRRALADAQRALASLASRAYALDPARALERGWTITVGADGRAVRHVADLAPGAMLMTRFADGTATSTVAATSPNPAQEAGP